MVLRQLTIQGLINSRRQTSRGRPSWRVPNVGDYRIAGVRRQNFRRLLKCSWVNATKRIRKKSTVTYSTERVKRERKNRRASPVLEKPSALSSAAPDAEMLTGHGNVRLPALNRRCDAYRLR